MSELKDNFYNSIHCTTGINCQKCRNTSEEGILWRKSILQFFEVKNNEINFECINNKEWNTNYYPEIISTELPKYGDENVPKELSNTFFCPIYELNIEGNMDEICKKCTEDPNYKQHLFNQYLLKVKEKSLSIDCINRSKNPIRESEKKCCGGNKKVGYFNCSKYNKEILQEECYYCMMEERSNNCGNKTKS